MLTTTCNSCVDNVSIAVRSFHSTITYGSVRIRLGNRVRKAMASMTSRSHRFSGMTAYDYEINDCSRARSAMKRRSKVSQTLSAWLTHQRLRKSDIIRELRSLRHNMDYGRAAFILIVIRSISVIGWADII